MSNIKSVRVTRNVRLGDTTITKIVVETKPNAQTQDVIGLDLVPATEEVMAAIIKAIEVIEAADRN